MNAVVTTHAVLDQLTSGVQATGLSWWNTPIITMLHRQAPLYPLVVALAGIGDVLRDGGDPDGVAGGTTAHAAVTQAARWLSVDVEPHDVALWLRAGCHNPDAARRMWTAGINPRALLDDSGKPLHFVDGTDGCPVPLALAVSNDEVSVADALNALADHKERQ